MIGILDMAPPWRLCKADAIFRRPSGLASAAGTYSIKVSATDATGAAVSVATETTGTVDEVDLSGANPVLVIGTSRVPLSSVTGIGLSTTSG